MPDLTQESKYTPGLDKALSTKACSGCGFPLPRYPGRYPSKCPHCGQGIADRPTEQPADVSGASINVE